MWRRWIKGLWRVSLRLCFFFQAEDGIRDYKVTGVQTCALPISSARAAGLDEATLQQAETNVRAAAAGGAAGGPAGATASEAYNKAFPIATQAYKIGRASCRGRG